MNLVKTAAISLMLAASAFGQTWVKDPVPTSASFRGLSVVDEKIVWASGTGGTVIRTVDGGRNWKVMEVPGADKLDFRDIEAFDVNTAYVLSIGNGDSSRIYKTTDGGATWKLQFTNDNEKMFFDSIACWDRSNCIAMSDPFQGHYPLIGTTDGTTWKPIVSNKMPAAKDGEAAFAASGTCLITHGKSLAFIVSGGADARVFRSADRGVTWDVNETPIVRGSAGSGVFSIAMWDERNGVAVGGNYEKPNDSLNTFTYTVDGGRTWASGTDLKGYRSGVTFIDRKTIVAVGTSGSDISRNGGQTWNSLDKQNYNAVAAKGRRAVWAVGPKGMVARLVWK